MSTTTRKSRARELCGRVRRVVGGEGTLLKNNFAQELLAQVDPYVSVIHRSKFSLFWSDLPPLTVLASAPGWGKTIWMMQCAEAVGDDKTEWIRGLHKLHKVVAEIEQLQEAPKDTVYLIDGIESALSENPALWEQILAIAEVGSVVVACYCVPVSVIPLATVLDERHLAFDRAELEQITARLVADSAVLDMFVLPESMRGCPWIVGRDVARIRARSTGHSRVISELSSSALCYKSFRDNPGFMESGAGRALVAAGGLPVVTEALLAKVASDIDASYCYARMSAWPIFNEVVDDESGEDALRWVPDAWKMMQQTTSKEEQRSVLEAGLRAEVDRGSIVGEARALLMLGRLIEAERLAERRLRRLLLFASPDCARLLSETVSDFSHYPALAILFSEIQTWELGNTEATKARSLRAARSVAMRKATGLFDEFARASMVAFGAVSGGDRLLAGRFLDHVLELLGDFDPSSEDVDKDARQALSGQLYLSYWVAIQLDRHEDALTLANSIVTVGNPSDRIMPMERVCAATQMDLGGFTSLSDSKPPHPDDPISNAAALRDLEDADDEVAVSRLRAVINHPDPMPSRSAIDGLVLLVRGIADPQELLVSQVDTVVERSSLLWGGAPSSFVALGAMVCYVSLGAQTRACELIRQVDSEDVFSSLGRVIWYQWRGEHERVVEITDRLLKKPMMPRFEVLIMVLQAASLCSQRNFGAAQSVLQMAWRSHRAPRLMRFAFRFVPLEIADQLISSVEQGLGGGLPDALSVVRNDPRPFIWSKRPALTRSELEILNMLRKGLSNAEIARQRFVVIGTLRNQLKSIYRKLEVADRHEAVDAAYRLGLFDPRDGDDEAGA